MKISPIAFCLAFVCVASPALAQKVLPRDHKQTQPPAVSAQIAIYNEGKYDVVVVRHPEKQVRLFWKGDDGRILKSLGNLKRHVEKHGQKLLMATNAGMYTTENGPKGLYIEKGKELKRIDLKKGPATNFYMQPNGVFYITATGAHVVTSEAFSKTKEKVVYATQSGPMLVVDGVINKTFTPGSANLNIRSGVGVDKNGKAYFIISRNLVNFYDLAKLFKDKYGCDNALFLDGAICRMYVPENGRTDEDGDFGVMIGVTE